MSKNIKIMSTESILLKLLYHHKNHHKITRVSAAYPPCLSDIITQQYPQKTKRCVELAKNQKY